MRILQNPWLRVLFAVACLATALILWRGVEVRKTQCREMGGMPIVTQGLWVDEVICVTGGDVTKL